MQVKRFKYMGDKLIGDRVHDDILHRVGLFNTLLDDILTTVVLG